MAESQIPPFKHRDNKQAGPSTGHLFIVSAPSGAWKSTLCASVRQHLTDLAYSVSYTTRSPRKGEQEAVDYHFISEADFLKGIEEGRWAEWASVHGNYYGSSARWIEMTLKAGRDILMDIDLQGARQMMRRFPEAVTIFIMPPSLEELEKRLRKRGTDSSRSIELRLTNAKEELAQRDICRHVILNDDIDMATRELIALIEAYR